MTNDKLIQALCLISNKSQFMELLYGNNILSFSTDWKSKMATISLQTAQPCSK
jgi:hypothetical protein